MGKDNILVTNTLRGDMDSFTVLVKSYQNNLYNFLIRMTYSKEDAEEILQDVFFKAYKYLYKYNRSWSFSTWIYRIAVNTFKSDYRKRKKHYESISYNQISIDPSPTIEDMRETIDKNIKTIVFHPKDPVVGFSSNAYDEIIQLGEPALAYILKKFE